MLSDLRNDAGSIVLSCAVSKSLTLARMSLRQRHEIRMRNLQLALGRVETADTKPLVDGVTALADRMGNKAMKGHLSNCLSGARGIGDALAASIEQALGVAPGWLDENHDGAGAMSMQAEAVINGLANQLRQVARDRRPALGQLLQSFAMAPDSEELRQDLLRALGSDASRAARRPSVTELVGSLPRAPDLKGRSTGISPVDQAERDRAEKAAEEKARRPSAEVRRNT